MNTKQKLLKKLDDLPNCNNPDFVFQYIFEAVTEYMRKTSEYSLDIALEGILHKSELEKKVVRVIEQSGIEVALDYLNVDEVDFTRSYYWDSGYGDIANLEMSDIEHVIYKIKRRLNKLDDGDEENDTGNET